MISILLHRYTEMKIQDKIDAIVAKNNSLVCIGLDSDYAKIPEHLKNDPTPLFTFNKAIIDATYDVVCAYKPNSAFYEGFGDQGVKQLKMTFDYINETYPDIITILDAKRGDIGNTNQGYTRYAFEWLNADIITVHAYFGYEACAPFLEREDKGAVLMCRSSNPGGGEFQDLLVDGEPLYKRVTRNILQSWNKNENCIILAGATYPEEMVEMRAMSGDTTFLVPGIGAQGGDVEKTVKAGKNSKGTGMLINSSRGIIFKSQGEDFAEKAREEAAKLRDEINKYR